MTLDWRRGCKAQGTEGTAQRGGYWCLWWKQKVCFEMSKGMFLQCVMKTS